MSGGRSVSIVSFLAQWEYRCLSGHSSEQKPLLDVVGWSKISHSDSCSSIHYELWLRYIRLCVSPPAYLSRNIFTWWSLIFFQETVSVEKVKENSFSKVQSKGFVANTKNSTGEKKKSWSSMLDLKWYNKRRFKAILALVPLHITDIYCFTSFQIKHSSTLA